MTLTVLISCMHEEDHSIILRSNIQTDAVVVNQCNSNSVSEFDFINKKGISCHVKFICTTERGLSKSRNMAIENAWGDICQICDDDETLPDNYEDVILNAYRENMGVGIITFALKRLDIKKSYPTEKKFIGLRDVLGTSSIQITFLRSLLCEANICFDEKMGSGTGNGGGEENRFLLDCRKVGIKMLYMPQFIATVNEGDSQWFKGYTEKFFRDRGWTSRRILGFFVGFAYIWYNAIRHRKEYIKDGMNLGEILLAMFRGFCEKR